MSSAANKARLLPVSFPHAASWLSVTPSEVHGLHLNPSQSLSGGLAWTFPMVLAAHCALRLSWSLLAIMLLPAKGVVMWFLATIDYMMSLQCPVSELIWVPRWKRVAVTPNHSHTCSADLLVPNWVLGKSAAFDLSVTSPLNPTINLEASVTTGAAARNTEQRKHCSNNAKCDELAYVCVPLVVESYGAWGKEAISQLVLRLATCSSKAKSMVVTELYGHLTLCEQMPLPSFVIVYILVM